MSCARPIVRTFFVFAIALLSGCTFHYVSSTVLKPVDAPVERMLIVIQKGTFDGGGTASNFGNRNLRNLIPHLEAQLPLVFAANGIEARALISEQHEKQLPAARDTNEATLLISPVSAFYSSQSGQQLKLMALLISPKPALPVWQGSISLNTPGFGKFDAELAKKVAADLLEKLDDDKMIRLPDGKVHSIAKISDGK